jgi:hypothetical protein
MLHAVVSHPPTTRGEEEDVIGLPAVSVRLQAAIGLTCHF